MVWGKPASGAWANAVEEEEQEHGTIQAPAAVPERDFPTLGVAVTVKENKKEKKKKQTMSLGDFMSSGGSSSRRYEDAVVNLPTAPRGRVEGEEDSNPLGGGFRGYGGDRYGGGGRGGGARFGDREDRAPRRERDEEDLGPSRADTADNWGAERKFVPGGGGGGDRYERRDSSAGGFRDRGSFGGGFRDGEDRPPRREFDDGPSRADTGDWGARQFVPSTSSRRSYDEPRGGSGGFRERESFRDREGGRERESFREPTKADTEDRWERSGEVKPTGFDDRPRRPFDEGPRERRGFSDGWRGREQEVSGGPGSRDGSRDQWRKERAGGPGAEEDAGAPRERPKLVLKPRTASTDARPAGDSGRPSIFGAARPREDVLREQGRDPVQEDERLEAAAKAAVKPRKEKHTDDEATAAVHAKIAEAKAKAEEESATEEEKTKAAEEIAALEAELAKLKVESDEKPSFRGRDGERGERRERGSGGYGGENGRSGRSGERSDSRRRDNGASFRRRDDRERDPSRGRTGGERGGGDRW